ncbi:MAG: hypothetical protein GYB35_15810 [Algicola sp.]|nr:hypothetical protein [Algicola sp.]
MKNISYVLCLFILLFSCGTDDDSGTENQSQNNTPFYMTFTESQNNYDSRDSVGVGIDGALIEDPNFLVMTLATDFVTNSGEIIAVIITLEGDSSDGFGSGFEINGSNEDYILDFIYGKSSFSGNVEFSGSADDEDGAVYLKILSIDRDSKVISGNFGFTAVSDTGSESRTISNGFFNVNYQ